MSLSLVYRWNARRLTALIGICGALISNACSSPATEFSRHAGALGMRRDVVAGTAFQHLVFSLNDRPSRALHVYVDGDGTPWGIWGPATDPTPRNRLVLRLMALDPTPSIYLSRPCYLGLAEASTCSSALWTDQRYSEAVVSSMAAALSRILATREYDRLAWFGFSGGGTLVTLLAPRFAATTDVITIAANLDIDAWADFHNYSRLVGSLNPAREPPLPPRIRQRHYAGGQDQVVPKEIVARGRIDPDTLIVVPSYDHTCCWERMWPSLLTELEASSAF